MEQREGYKKTEIGWLPEDWDLKLLKDIADVNKSSLSNKTAKDFELLYIDIASIIRPGFISPPTKYSYADAPVRARRIVKYGDVIISTVRPYLKAFATIPWKQDNLVCSTGFAVISTNGNSSNDYIFQYSLSDYFHNQVNQMLVGSNYPAINSSDVKSISIPIPPLPEQKKIASILTTVDDKISSIGQQIQQTEQLKKGLMEKLLTEGIGHTEFKETKIGKVPVGWDVSTLAEAKINIIDGDRGTNYPKQDDFYEDGFCLFLTAKNVSKSGFRFDETQYISEEIDGLLRKGKLVRNDIVITTRGTVGNIAWYNNDVKLENIRINSGMALIRKSFENVDSLFLYLLFRSHLVQKQIKLIAFGTAQPQLTIKEIKKFRIVIPPLPEQKQIATILSTVDDKIETLSQKKSEYQTLKKGLSQQLLTGQIRVKI